MKEASENQSIIVRTSPSLALIKYWGKTISGDNIPATSSIATNLHGFYTETKISLSKEKDCVTINGSEVLIGRFTPFFNQVRKELHTHHYFNAVSQSNFPTSAGLASSSSGFAALAYGCAQLVDSQAPLNVISSLARLGSASASRALFPGFTVLKRNSLHAEQLYDQAFWPEFRIIIAIVKSGPKKISSRHAMEVSRKTSPYYHSWLEESECIFSQALPALDKKNLKTLGPLIRQSYLMMFGTMFTTMPPIFYWEPDTVALIKTCEDLREQGYSIWETMDAGPQVKMITLKDNCENVYAILKNKYPHINFVISQPGEGPIIVNEPTHTS